MSAAGHAGVTGTKIPEISKSIEGNGVTLAQSGSHGGWESPHYRIIFYHNLNYSVVNHK